MYTIYLGHDFTSEEWRNVNYLKDTTYCLTNGNAYCAEEVDAIKFDDKASAEKVCKEINDAFESEGCYDAKASVTEYGG